MASETTPETILLQEQLDVVVDESLPFSGLDHTEFAHIVSGPRISSTKGNPKKFYGPVTLRNYLAGYAKMTLRLSKPKGIPESPVFLKLPIELKLLVLEHLHPLDLYHISQVSKSFRKFILDPKVLEVWKVAFMRHPDLPTPPPRIKESDWAFMIYGPGICSICGKYGALTDFSFLKRFCGFCLKDHCLPVHTFRDESNHTIPPQHDIWSLLPKSYRFNGLRYNMYVAQRFLKTDFASMWKKLKLIRILVKHGVPLVSELFEEYKTALASYIQRLDSSATEANNWATDVFRQFSDEYEALTLQLAERCTSRLQVLGHEKQDIVDVSASIRAVFREEAIYRLTCRTFRMIRPRLELLITAFKIERIETARRKLLKGIYKDYLKSLPPDEWQYLPHVDARYILDIEPFQEFLQAPYDKRGDMAPGYAASLFPESTDKWAKARREEIVSLLPTLEGASETFEVKAQRLELATSVVTCRDCIDISHHGFALVGWKNIRRHQRSAFNGSPDKCRTYVISRSAIAAATALVFCVGLDPLTTTADDMIRRDDRFICGNCLPDTHRGRKFMRVYTWLECLEHTMTLVNLYTSAIDSTHETPAWHLLSPAGTRFVREHERPYPHHSHHIWRCNHCAHHFEDQTFQEDVVTHVKRVHCIREPVIGTDVVADRRLRIRKRRPFRLFRDPAFENRCKHCSNLPIFQLWEKDALKDHLIKKHHINEPVKNVDWETVEMISASATLVPTRTPEDTLPV